jgi:hypothetical protein
MAAKTINNFDAEADLATGEQLIPIIVMLSIILHGISV